MRFPRWRCAFLIVAFALVAPRAAAAQKPLGSVRDALQQRIARHKGIVGLTVIDLQTGDTLSIRGNEPFPTASVIKLPILVELFHQMGNSRIRWSDPIALTEADRVGGSGILQHLSMPHQLTVGDAATLMIALSDNTATNLIIDKLGIRAVNARMDSLGFKSTKLYAKVFKRAGTTIDSAGSARWGLGVTTPNDIAGILAGLYRNQLVSDSASARMVSLLKLQFVRDRIPRLLPAGTVVAHKTGEVDDSKNDCGIVYARERAYVFCAFTRENTDRRWVADNEALQTVAELSRLVYDTLIPAR